MKTDRRKDGQTDKVKPIYPPISFSGGLKIFSPWIYSSLLFYKGIPNLAHGCITLRQHVVYIHDLCMTLTFDRYVSLNVINSQFFSCLILGQLIEFLHQRRFAFNVLVLKVDWGYGLKIVPRTLPRVVHLGFTYV